MSARYVLEYTYTRSVGPVIGAFLEGLREGRIQGARTKTGRVIVPPAEYDPLTGEEIVELVPVGTSGVVKTWCWVDAPRPTNPLQQPFAWVLVQLDGADTALLHALDADEPRTGMRVRPRWRPERAGAISDIACFEVAP